MKEKIKIMKTRPGVTDEEIKSFMNFDALLDQKDKLVGKHRNLQRVRNIAIGLGCLLLVPTALFLLSEDRTKQDAAGIPIKRPQPSITVPSVAGDSLQKVRAEQRQTSPPKSGKEETSPALPSNTALETPGEAEEVAAPQQPVYAQAEPIDGYPALYDYFDKHLRYPVTAAKERIEGVVDVSFVIDTTGKAVRITVENSLGEAFDKEVVRLMEDMPPWRPASYNGKPVHSKISLPITFSAKQIANP